MAMFIKIWDYNSYQRLISNNISGYEYLQLIEKHTFTKLRLLVYGFIFSNETR